VGEFLGTKWEFFFFLLIFYFGKKRGWQHSGQFLKLFVHNLENPTQDMNSSRKNTQFQKKIIQNGVWEVEISLI
jgi:hypothetical protein